MIEAGFHRNGLYLAQMFFESRGGAAAYVLGEESLLWKMAQAREWLSVFSGLPEMAQPLSTHDYVEILKARGS